MTPPTAPPQGSTPETPHPDRTSFFVEFVHTPLYIQQPAAFCFFSFQTAIACPMPGQAASFNLIPAQRGHKSSRFAALDSSGEFAARTSSRDCLLVYSLRMFQYPYAWGFLGETDKPFSLL